MAWLLLAVLVLSAAIYRLHADDHASAATVSGLYKFGDWSGQFNSPDSGGNNPLIKWKTLETADGVYNWAALDSAIAAANTAGKHIVPRIYTNVDDQEQGSPDWFFAAGGQYYYPADGGPKSPVPWDNLYKQEFGQFLSALGARYNGNPGIEFWQTNAGGGAYGESWLRTFPPGYTAQIHIDTQKYWLDRWKAAFPSTPLAVMVNELGSNILQDVSDYAADNGVWLQTNMPWIAQSVADAFIAQAPRTRIVMEVEDAGCQSSTLAKGFTGMISHIFGFGFPIDYLMLCGESFADPATAATLPSVQARLRTWTSSSALSDEDGDGYTYRAETWAGTDPADNCGQLAATSLAWPSDLYPSNSMTFQDIGSFIAPVPHLNTVEGQPGYARRWDIYGQDAAITQQDIGALFTGTSGYPPMFSGSASPMAACSDTTPAVPPM